MGSDHGLRTNPQKLRLVEVDGGMRPLEMIVRACFVQEKAPVTSLVTVLTNSQKTPLSLRTCEGWAVIIQLLLGNIRDHSDFLKYRYNQDRIWVLPSTAPTDFAGLAIQVTIETLHLTI